MSRRDRLVAEIADLLGLERSDITLESHFVCDLAADELDIIEIAMAIEEAFDVDISDEDWESVSTLADVEALLDKLGVPTI